METIQNKLLSFSVDSDGIGTLVINQTEESTNLFSEAFIIQYIEVTQQAIADENVKV